MASVASCLARALRLISTFFWNKRITNLGRKCYQLFHVSLSVPLHCRQQQPPLTASYPYASEWPSVPLLFLPYRHPRHSGWYRRNYWPPMLKRMKITVINFDFFLTYHFAFAVQHSYLLIHNCIGLCSQLFCSGAAIDIFIFLEKKNQSQMELGNVIKLFIWSRQYFSIDVR